MKTTRGALQLLSWRVGGSVCVLLLGLMTVSGFRATVSGGEQQPSGSDYSKIGRHATMLRCYDSYEGFRRCEGYSRTQFPDSVATESDSQKLIKWFSEREWEDATGWIERLPVAGGDTTNLPTMRVQVIANPKRFSFKKISSDGVVLARLHVRSDRQKDALYGLGGAEQQDYDSLYYLVADGYDTTKPDRGDAKTGERRPISNWYVLGVKTSNGKRIVRRVGKTGTISWCGIPHSSIPSESAFTTCLAQELAVRLKKERRVLAALDSVYPGGPERKHSVSWIVEAIQAYRSRTVSDTAAGLATINPFSQLLQLANPQFDPVWITCGVGCCIAEL